MSNLTKALIQVLTSKGAFDSEYAVEVNCINGDKVSFFVDKSDIKTKGNNEYINVFIVEDESNSQVKRVLLPSETFETSSRWIEVPEASVK